MEGAAQPARQRQAGQNLLCHPGRQQTPDLCAVCERPAAVQRGLPQVRHMLLVGCNLSSRACAVAWCEPHKQPLTLCPAADVRCRYLERNMRDNLGFAGTPIRLYLRARRTAEKPEGATFQPAASTAGRGSAAGRGGRKSGGSSSSSSRGGRGGGAKR